VKSQIAPAGAWIRSVRPVTAKYRSNTSHYRLST
jgi:hypothetical protein